jgi:hypothetical protein
VGLREALDAQRAQLERHYAGLHAKMRKEYEQVGTIQLHCDPVGKHLHSTIKKQAVA